MNFLYLTSIEIDGKSAASNHVTEMIAGLINNDIKVDLISSTCKLKNIRFIGKSKRIWFPKFKGGWLIFKIQVSIYCFFNRFKKYNIVYFRLSPSKLLAHTIKYMKGVKAMELNGLEIIHHKEFKYIISSADKVFVSTETTKNVLTEYYPERFQDILINSNVGIRINNFIEKDKTDSRRKLSFKDDDIIFILVSGFQNHHDFDTVLKAFSLFNEKRPLSKLILIGDGPRKKEIEDKVDLYFNKSIFLTGSLYIDEIADYISASDICLNIMYSSKLKHHGNLNAQKTYEYMAVGRPVIETCIDNQFIPLWAKDKLVIISPESVSELYAAFNIMIDDYQYYEEKALENKFFINKNYSWNKIATNLIDQLEVKP